MWTGSRDRSLAAPGRLPLVMALALAVPAAAASPDGGTLNLDALVSEALRQHPRALAARHAAAAAHEVGSRAASMPDPVFGVQAQNIRVDAPALDTSPMSAIQIGVSEAIPFPGKLSRRGAVADAHAEVLDRQEEASDSSVALEVRVAYWRLHFAERALEITLQSERVMNGLANAVIARLSVGKAPQQDALQAQVAQSTLRAHVRERREAVTSAQRALNAAVGRPPTAGLPPTAAPLGEPLADRAQLVARALAENPTLLAAQARVAAAQKAVAEAQYDRWPDLQVGLAYRFRAVVPGDPSNGADMFSATLGVTLPVFMSTKQNARVREARLELSAAEASRDAATLAITTALERALDAVARLDEELGLYRTELLPEVDKALDASAVDYQVGSVGFVSVLQNWQAQLSALLAHEQLVTERAQRVAEVKSLVEKEPLQ